METTTPKKFWGRKAAEQAVEEASRSGWAAGVLGVRAPFMVQAVSSREIEAATGFSIKYDLHKNGMFVEYSRRATR